MFGADFVGQPSESPIRSFVAVEFLARPHIDGIYDKVVVQGSRIHMRSDQHLMIAAPHSPCKLYTELVAEFWCDLAGLEALISVIGDVPSCFSETLLYGKHFFKRCVGVTVDSCDKTGFFVNRFVAVLGVMQDRLQIRQNRFVGIGGLLQHTGKAVLNRPYLGRCHCRPPFRNKRRVSFL